MKNCVTLSIKCLYVRCRFEACSAAELIKLIPASWSALALARSFKKASSHRSFSSADLAHKIYLVPTSHYLISTLLTSNNHNYFQTSSVNHEKTMWYWPLIFFVVFDFQRMSQRCLAEVIRIIRQVNNRHIVCEYLSFDDNSTLIPFHK